MALRDWWDMIYSVIKTAEPVDILDILVLSYVVYLAMKLVRETRAGQLIKGIFLILSVYDCRMDSNEGNLLSAV